MRLRTLISFITAGVILSACDLGLPASSWGTAPSPPLEVPDLTGEWTLTFAAYPNGVIDGQGGACTFGPTRFSLTRAPDSAGGLNDGLYVGVASATRLVCSGITAAATQSSGIRDTIIEFPVAPVKVSMSEVLCFGFGECPNRGRVAVYSSVGSIGLSGYDPSPRLISGTGVGLGRPVNWHGSWRGKQE